MMASNDAVWGKEAGNVKWAVSSLSEDVAPAWIAALYSENGRFMYVDCNLWLRHDGLWRVIVKEVVTPDRVRIRAEEVVAGTEYTAKRVGEALLRAAWCFAESEE